MDWRWCMMRYTVSVCQRPEGHDVNALSHFSSIRANAGYHTEELWRTPLRSWVFCNFLPQPPERFHRIGNLLFAELELEGGPSTIQGLYDSIGL